MPRERNISPQSVLAYEPDAGPPSEAYLAPLRKLTEGLTDPARFSVRAAPFPDVIAASAMPASEA